VTPPLYKQTSTDQLKNELEDCRKRMEESRDKISGILDGVIHTGEGDPCVCEDELREVRFNLRICRGLQNTIKARGESK
jgi:hypothetical protein